MVILFLNLKIDRKTQLRNLKAASIASGSFISISDEIFALRGYEVARI